MKKLMLSGISLAIATIATAASPPEARYNYIDEIKRSALSDVKDNEQARTLLPSGTTFETGLTYSSANQRLSTNRLPAKASLSGASFEGWLAGTADDPGGWYSLDTDGSYKMHWTALAADLGIKLVSGWTRDGKVCGLGSFAAGGLVMYYNYLEFDKETGTMLKETPIGADNLIDMSNYYLSSVYVPSEDRIYGYTYTDAECNGFRFSSSPANDIADVTTIKPLTDVTERTCALCYNEEEDKFFGVNFNGDFVSIDRQGNETILFNLQMETLRTDPSALVYSPLDGCYIFCAYYYDYASQLYYIYPDAKKVVFIRNFPADYQFTFLLNPDAKYDPEAPGRPELLRLDVASGALGGNIGYRLPATKCNGSKLEGELGWTLYIDNRPLKTGSAAAGSEISIALENMEQGSHVLRMACSYAGKEGLSNAMSVYFGNGIPFEPENVVLTETKVTWKPVTKAEQDAYLDLSALEYDVYINDKFQGTTSDTEYAITLDPEATVSAHYAQVVAKCKGLRSGKGVSGKLIYGAPIELPYTITPTREQADICHIINADGGPAYGIWDFSEARWHEPVFYSGWSNDPCDDWLVLPPVDCSDISHAYRVTFDAICGGMTGKDERFEVWCGNAPTVEAMKTLIVPETQVSEFITAGWETFSNLFVPRQAGPCYIAIRSVSPPNQYSLLIRNIRIEATDQVADVPAAPTDIEVVSKSDANLTATVKFTLPTRTITGSAIPEDGEVKAVLKVLDKVVEQDALPGKTVTVTVPTYQGMNRIEAICSLRGQYGQSITTNLFTGTVPPGYIENFKSEVTEDNLGIKMQWSEPTGPAEDEEGYYSTDGMHYYLYELYVDEYGESEWQESKDLGNVNEYTYTVPATSQLSAKYVAILAANNGGKSRGLTYVNKVIGKPYAKIKETFKGGKLNYGPIRNISAGEAYAKSTWQMVVPEEVNSDYWSAKVPYAIIGYTDNETGGSARLGLPKVSTSGIDTPVLQLTLWTGEPCGDVKVYAACYDNQLRPAKIFDVPALNNGWQTVNIPIPAEYRDKQWVELAVDTKLDNAYTYTLIGGYYFGSAQESGATEAVADRVSVTAAGGEVVVNGAEGEVMLFTIDGTCIARETADGTPVTFKAGKGVYIVHAPAFNTKVMVK